MARNDITGDSLISRVPSKEYLYNYDLIFGKKDKEEVKQESSKNTTDEQPSRKTEKDSIT